MSIVYLGKATPASGSGGGSITVDQTYDPISTNAQSGTAVAEAVATKQDVIDANNKLSASYVSGLATVATTGDYGDLSNTPTIPAAQVNSDWNAVSGVAQILNKPNLATVATSGSYNDLLNKPTIPTVIPADNSTITENASNELQTVGIVNQNTNVGAISPLKVWNGTEQEWNTGGEGKIWYKWAASNQIETTSTSPSTTSIHQYMYANIQYVNGKYFALGYYATNTSRGSLLSSSDGINWNIDSIDDITLKRIIYENNKFIAIGNSGTIRSSIDGSTWTNETSGVNTNLITIIYKNNKFIVIGKSGTILTSTDGNTWTSESSGTVEDLNNIIYENNKFIVLGNNGTILTSTDGSVWTTESSGVSTNLSNIIYKNNKFIIIADSGTILTSTDGSTWTSETSGTSENLNRIIYENNKFIIIGDAGTILTSTDGSTWTSENSGTSENLIRIVYGDGKYVTIGGKAIFSSTNGSTWTQETIPTIPSNNFRDLKYNNGMYVSVAQVSSRANFYYSYDGSNWFKQAASQKTDPRELYYINGKYITGCFYNSTISPCAVINYIPGSIAYTEVAEPTTSSTVYSEPNVASTLTITSVGTGNIVLSDTKTYEYKSNQSVSASIGETYPNWLCFINGVGVKIGTTTIAQVNAS